MPSKRPLRLTKKCLAEIACYLEGEITKTGSHPAVRMVIEKCNGPDGQETTFRLPNVHIRITAPGVYCSSKAMSISNEAVESIVVQVARIAKRPVLSACDQPVLLGPSVEQFHQMIDLTLQLSGKVAWLTGAFNRHTPAPDMLSTAADLLFQAAQTMGVYSQVILGREFKIEERPAKLPAGLTPNDLFRLMEDINLHSIEVSMMHRIDANGIHPMFGENVLAGAKNMIRTAAELVEAYWILTENLTPVLITLQQPSGGAIKEQVFFVREVDPPGRTGGKWVSLEMGSGTSHSMPVEELDRLCPDWRERVPLAG